MVEIKELLNVLYDFIPDNKKEYNVDEDTDIMTDLEMDSIDIMQFIGELEFMYSVSFVELDDFYKKFRTLRGIRESIIILKEGVE